MKETRKKAIEVINDMIIEELLAAKLSDEKLVWQRPWFIYPKQNYLSGYEYNAVNKLLLGDDDNEFYLTLKQVNELGGEVKNFNWKYVYNSFRKKREVDANYKPKFYESIEVIQGVRYAVTWQNTYTKLLKLSDTDIPVQKEGKSLTIRPDLADFIQHRFPVKVIHGGTIAEYNVDEDIVRVPDIDRFDSEVEYYKTLFHQVAHACGSPTRLKRFTEFPAEGTKQSLREELTAELTAAAMVHKFGIEFNVKNTAAYVDQWIDAVKADEKLFVLASSQAEKVLKYLGV